MLARNMKSIYLALAMEGIPSQQIRQREQEFRNHLKSIKADIWTTFDEMDKQTDESESKEKYAMRIVERDLQLLRRSDLLLVDLSVSGHTYVGCMCEIVYARIMKIPIVLFVGDTGNETRTWLIYHADALCSTMNATVEAVSRILGIKG